MTTVRKGPQLCLLGTLKDIALMTGIRESLLLILEEGEEALL